MKALSCVCLVVVFVLHLATWAGMREVPLEAVVALAIVALVLTMPAGHERDLRALPYIQRFVVGFSGRNRWLVPTLSAFFVYATILMFSDYRAQWLSANALLLFAIIAAWWWRPRPKHDQ